MDMAVVLHAVATKVATVVNKQQLLVATDKELHHLVDTVAR